MADDSNTAPDTARVFPLADILSVTTGLMLTRRTPSPGAALDEIFQYMTGEKLAWWQAPRAADACTDAFIQQHPFLADLKPPKVHKSPIGKATLLLWLTTAELKHGTQLPVEPLTDWVRQDSGQELLDRIELVNLPSVEAGP
ncbi:DUF7736 domain-containing protein [Streptomyces rubrogriseus]|uniref:DUF7736 domain-containing protein n=1 Tax=Streptomyces rubrogriseus TaxID=194673 RepID=UPI000D590A8B|nr:hypothetical protein [Streptomyces rubrogriseus]